MDTLLTLAGQNLLTPMILSFALGGLAALARSDLSVPEAAAKTMALYLLFAIGFKGGVAVSKSGVDGQVLAAMGVDRRLGRGALRLTLGRTTTEADVQRGVDAVVASVRRLRKATA